MMIDKITLYREVLELEPGSRVFFPLAKLLADKEPTEAILILKKGLSRHPDHVEARIFLIELLSANEGDADLDNELDIVSSILRNYPSFWKIWSAHLAQDSELHDAALAINFFGAGLSGRSVTWTDVIAHGLNALLVEDGDETTPPLPFSSDVSRLRRSSMTESESFTTQPASSGGGMSYGEASHDEGDKAVPHSFEQDSEALTEISSSPAQADVAGDSVSDAVALPYTLDDIEFSQTNESLGASGQPQSLSAGVSEVMNAMDSRVGAVDFVESEEENEEPFSLRTRTMADLLAEQGDFDGAIDIYNELLAVANENERLAIADKLQELEVLRQQSAVPGTPKKDMGVIADSDGGKLVSLLESLASRFENRAR